MDDSLNMNGTEADALVKRRDLDFTVADRVDILS